MINKTKGKVREKMSLKKVWNQFLDKYMKSTAEKIKDATFADDEIKRYRVIFSGIVQGVGFRYETWAIAQKLQLTGFVENLPNGTVYAELQGPENKILYLIECLKTVPRIQIEKLEMVEMELKNDNIFEIAN